MYCLAGDPLSHLFFLHEKGRGHCSYKTFSQKSHNDPSILQLLFLNTSFLLTNKSLKLSLHSIGFNPPSKKNLSLSISMFSFGDVMFLFSVRLVLCSRSDYYYLLWCCCVLLLSFPSNLYQKLFKIFIKLHFVFKPTPLKESICYSLGQSKTIYHA